jgi:hypothetical protein
LSHGSARAIFDLVEKLDDLAPLDFADWPCPEGWKDQSVEDPFALVNGT